MAQAGGEVIVTGEEGEECCEPEECAADCGDGEMLEAEDAGAGLAEDEESEGAHLGGGFPFGEACDGQSDADFGEIFAQSADQDFAQHDDDGGVESGVGQAGEADEEHEGCADQEFIGDGVEHAAEIGGHGVIAGEFAVEPVGDAGGGEDEGGEQIGDRGAQGDEQHQHRDGGDA